MEMYQHDGATSFRFVLKGDLCGLAVEQLEWAWHTAKSILRSKDLIVDVSEITKADPPGVELLSRMQKAGAHLTADLPPASAELNCEMDIPVLPPRRFRGISMSVIWRRWLTWRVRDKQSTEPGRGGSMDVPT